MTDKEIDARLVERFLAAQSSAGRFRMNWSVRWKRVSWKWIVSGAFFVKRTFDIVGSVILILLLAPLFFMIALLIKIEDGGAIVFRQTRVGRFGHPFKMYKFRSMCVNAEERMKELLAKNRHLEGVTFKMKDDPRITKIGKW
ncbi:MAG: sugar transferase, partial [Limisphaerales bacterium]